MKIIKNSMLKYFVFIFPITLFGIFNIPLTLSIVNTIDDPANDVIKMNGIQAISKGDYADGIDILNLNIDNQYIIMTFDGDFELLTETNTRVAVEINFLTTIDNETEMVYQKEYAINFQINSEQYDSDFILRHFIPLGEGVYTAEEWDGDSFNYNFGSGISIGNFSGNTIEAFIPSDAFLVENSEVIYAFTSYGNESAIFQGKDWYFDICPEEYNPYDIPQDDDDVIPGYELTIILCSLFVVSFYIIRSYRKFKL